MSRAATQAQIRFLVDRQKQLENEVFSAPPADWASFLLRLGAWQENHMLQVKLVEIERGIEERD